MKNKSFFLILFFIVGLVSHCFSMEDRLNGLFNNLDKFKAIGEGLNRAGRGIQQGLQEAQEAREDAHRNKLLDINADITKARNEEERMLHLKRKEKLEDAHLGVQHKWEGVAAGMAGVGPDIMKGAFQMFADEAASERDIAKAAVTAEGNKDAAIENAKQYIAALTDPKNAKLLALTATLAAAGICGAWHGSKVLAGIVQQYLNKIPTIAEETSLISVKEKIVNYFTKKKPESNISDVILETNLAERISDIADTVKNTVTNDGYFQHMLLYGPPGTGKTMLAKRLARSSGLEYIYFAGGSALEQLGIEDALSRLTELFEFSKRSSKKLMIIIDEAEVLLADRNKNISDKTRKLLNLTLGYTGTEQNNFIIVALTNRPEDLDSAFLNRCDQQIEIGVPGPEEKVKILESYVNKLLLARTKIQPRPSFFARMFGAKQPQKRLTIDVDALSKNELAKIAAQLDHFVGRDISKLVIAIQSAAYASSTGRITKDLVNRVVQQKKDQKLKQLGFQKTE